MRFRLPNKAEFYLEDILAKSILTSFCFNPPNTFMMF